MRNLLKILVVDDKTIIRKGLVKKIQWESLGCILAGEAENGTVALRMITELKPDIVITDIRMPECDGISLLKHIYSNNTHIQTIVISGYDDFEYAQQAIKNGCIDYILKPINAAELNKSIEKACNIIKMNEKAKLLPGRTAQLSGYLYRIMHDMEIESESGFEQSDLDSIRNGYFCISVVRSFDSKNVPKDEFTKESFEDYNYLFSVCDKKEQTIIFCIDIQTDCRFIENKIYGTINRLIFENKKEDTEIIVGIGKLVMGIEQLHSSYNAALEALSYSLLNREQYIFKYSAVIEKKQFIVPAEEYESRLLLNVTSGNIQAVNELLEAIFDKILSIKDISISSISLQMAALCHVLLRIDSEFLDEIQKFLAKINNPDYLLSFKSIVNMKQVILNLFQMTMYKLQDSRGGKKVLVKKVKELISKNYYNEINVEAISKLFFISVPYLSKIFKSETGENLNEYITNFRIEEAKKLLKNDNNSIPQIAQSVGFPDHVYFYKVFKKITGVTPGEFRENRGDRN